MCSLTQWRIIPSPLAGEGQGEGELATISNVAVFLTPTRQGMGVFSKQYELQGAHS